jgi:hypothetical protein
MFSLINEEKRSLLNQHKQPPPTAITTCSLTVEFRQHTPAKLAVEVKERVGGASA